MICLFTKMLEDLVSIKYPRNDFLKRNGVGKKQFWENVESEDIKCIHDSSRNVPGALLGSDPLLWPLCET